MSLTKEKKIPVNVGDEDEVVVSENEHDEDEEVADPVEELEAKLKETTDRLMRTAAELDNVRKRARRDNEEAVVRGRSEILREIIPVIDSIDLALRSADPEGTAAAIVEGVEMVRRQFLSATEKFGLKQIEARGMLFDPNFHEAMAQVASDETPAGEVVEEMRKGYLLGERLLRPAMVIVSKGSAAQEDGEEKEGEQEEAAPADGGAETEEVAPGAGPHADDEEEEGPAPGSDEGDGEELPPSATDGDEDDPGGADPEGADPEEDERGTDQAENEGEGDNT
jgi:molecular chaperone GrpE